MPVFLPRLRRAAAVAMLLPLSSTGLAADSANLANWQPDRSPQKIGQIIAEHFLESPDERYPDGGFLYSEAGLWYGALKFAEATHDSGLRDKLIRKFEPLLPGGVKATEVSRQDDSVHSVFGIVPLEIYIETKDPKYLAFGISFAHQQWNKPLPNGLSHETRFYVDDMYMLPMVQLQAYRATGDRTYLNRGIAELIANTRRLQRPNGLFYHTPDFPFFWARGEGWAAVGMTEMLLSLPQSDPRRGGILASYRKMMAALLRYQSRDGTWRQLIDHPEAWEESSATGMFAYALISGVKHGWLPAAIYKRPERMAWLAATGFIDQNNDVTSISESVFHQEKNARWYLERHRKTGDFTGQEPILWAASALLQP